MNEVFLAVLNNVCMSSVIMIAIMLFRLLFKNIPRAIYPVVWGIVGLKLLLPFDLYSSFGLLPGNKTIEAVSDGNAPVVVRTGVQSVDQSVNRYIGAIGKNAVTARGNSIHFLDIFQIIWIVGIVGMVLYLLISYVSMKRKVSQSVLLELGVSICDEISSPFLLGILKPHIYIPSGLEKTKYEYILAHEKMHIKRKDSLWKAVGFCLLSVYWFHPLCWVAYILFCRDIELACDEGVIRKQEPAWRADYCQTLLECCTNRRKVIFVPLGFGEVSVKERIRRVMQYKKAKLSVIVVSAIVCAAVIFCFGTRQRVKTDQTAKGKAAVTEAAGISVKAQAVKKQSDTADEISGKTPTIDLSAVTGADGARLYYADQNTIIFGGFFGLFVYDTVHHKYIQSVDLAEVGRDTAKGDQVGCNATQGDEYCEIQVKKDGSEVYLHKMNDRDHMYVYDVAENTFAKKPYHINKEDLFAGRDADREDAVTFKKGKKKKECWLINSWKTLGELGYQYPNDSDLVYPLFVEERLQGAGYFTQKDIKDIVRAEITFEGKHYVCEDKAVLKKLEYGYANGEKGKGLSACPFNDAMYLTRKDGTVGIVIPAMDSCRTCIVGDGWYVLDKSLPMSVYDMINKGLFRVQDT